MLKPKEVTVVRNLLNAVETYETKMLGYMCGFKILVFIQLSVQAKNFFSFPYLFEEILVFLLFFVETRNFSQIPSVTIKI